MVAQKIGVNFGTSEGDWTVKWTGITADHEDIQNIPPNTTGSNFILEARFQLFDGDTMALVGGYAPANTVQWHAGAAQITSWTWDGPAVASGRRMYPTSDGQITVPLYTPEVWWPGKKPVGTVIASGAGMNLGTVSALVDWQVKVSATDTPITCSVDARSMPRLEVSFTRQDANALLASNVCMDMLDDEGNWWVVSTFAPASALGVLVPAPQLTVDPYVSWSTTTWPSQTMAMNPTKVSFRLATDPVGSATLGTSDILYVVPDALDVAPEVAVNVGFDVSVDAYVPATVQVTGTPTSTSGPVIGVAGGPNYWISTDTGGNTVTLHDGSSTVGTYPMPAGGINGPVTLRLDGDTLFVIYNGVILFLYKLPPADFSALQVSGQYVGTWNGATSSLASTTTPSYPPLGGWHYLLNAWYHTPVGISPRLWKVWANVLESGLTWIYSPSLGTAWDVTGPSQEETEDPATVCYRGGWDYLVNRDVAQAIANAGGAGFLTAVD